MPTSTEWRDVLDAIQDGGGIARSDRVSKLYDLAAADGERLLAHRFPKLPVADRRDLIHDAMERVLAESHLLDAERPRAFFITVLTNVAIDRTRKASWRREVLTADMAEGTRGASSPDEKPSPEGALNEQERRERLGELLDLLTARQLEVLLDTAADVPSAQTAARLGITPANVDQIRHRAFERLRAAVRAQTVNDQDQR